MAKKMSAAQRAGLKKGREKVRQGSGKMAKLLRRGGKKK